MLSDLTEGFSAALSKIGLKKRLTEANVQESVREIRLALIDADVNLEVIKFFIARVKERALKTEVLQSITPGQQFTKILHDELVGILGDAQVSLDLAEPSRMSHILLCGLQGSGKTTTCAKLANRIKDKRDVLLVSLDPYRPAAAEQLKRLASQVGVAYFERGDQKDIKKIIKAAQKHAKREVHNLIIWDTAGRTQVNEELLQELKRIDKLIDPREKILVVDSMTGQQALSVAKSFKETLNITSLIFTKFDSETRGGAVLSVKEVVGAPIKFIGVGEKIDAFDTFVPQRMAERILGMGDIVGLVNKAKEVVDEQQATKMAEKLSKNEFDLQDFLEQLQQLKKMGSLQGILGMLPGVGQKLSNMNIDETQFDKIAPIICSMTTVERKKPFILNNNRKQRISKGSGTTIMEVNRLLKQFQQMKSMVHKMKNPNKMKKMMSQVMGQDFDPSMLESMNR